MVKRRELREFSSMVRDFPDLPSDSTKPDKTTIRDIEKKYGSVPKAINRARELLVNGAKEGRFLTALEGARLYEKLGRGSDSYVHRKLNQAICKEDRTNIDYDSHYESYERFNERNPEKSRLLKKVSVAASIIGILGGLFFLSSNITGNAIANVSQSSSNALGAVLLVVGLVAGFFWAKKK